MKKRTEEIERIEKALVQAHREAREAEAGPFFHRKVMARILEQRQVLEAGSGNGLSAGILAWRLALLSYVVVIFMVAQLMMADPDSQYLVSMVMLDDSSSVDLLSTFGEL